MPSTLPSHPLDAYVGTYTHPAYGDAIVTHDASGLRLRLGFYEFPIPHFHYDVFNFARPAVDPVRNRFRGRVTFQTDVDGSIGSLLAPVEPTVPPIALLGVATHARRRDPQHWRRWPRCSFQCATRRDPPR